MYVQCSTFLGVIQFILIIGLDCNDYYPEYEPTVTYSPNTTWLTSSEQERIDFKALDDHILNFTLPGTVADVLEKHGVIETKGWEERLNVAKTFYRNRKKKYYNNLTGLHQSYYQRMARIHAKMMDDIEFKDHNYRKDPGMHGEKIEKLVQELPEIQAMKLHQHEVTVDIPEYSGDIIKDDYEVRRKRRAVDETEIHVSNYQEGNEIIKDTHKQNVNDVSRSADRLYDNDKKISVTIGDDGHGENKGYISSGIDIKKMKQKKLSVKNKRRYKRETRNKFFTSDQDLLKSLKYLALKEKLGENHDIVKRHVDNKHGDVPSKKRELYKDYKSEWPYSKYDSNIHYDQILPAPKRRKISNNYSVLITPESSILNSFYNEIDKQDPERVKLKNKYRSMEYWTFTNPFDKYTSSSTKKYDQPYPTFGRNAATISVGASRFKLFNKNWYNEYKHRVHKRDVFNSDSTAGHLVNTIMNYLTAAGTVYNTIMTVYFKCMYNYMRDMYSSSYLSPSHQHVQPDTDQDYMDAIERIKQWYQKISNTSANSNLSFTILNEGYQQYTQYIALNWYTETYSDNRTQYFCDYGNDTYMLVNNKLQLFNKTLHQLVSFPDQNVTQPMTNDSIFLDVRTIEPPKLSWINSEELKKRNINVPDDEQYIIVKNLSDPFSMHRGSLNDIYGQKIPMSLYPSSNQTQKENIESSTNPANGNTFSLTLNQTVTDYPEDLLDKAADFVLSFYFKNTTMHEETTTDDYTEVTDCFDKFENAAIRFFKGSNNSTNSTPGNSRDITENLNWSNVSSTNKISLWASSNDMKNSTTNKIVSTSMNPATMTGVKNNLPKKHNLPIDQRKIRAKRSLLSRCIKGLKLVGGVFRPVEKGVVNVLDDVFGPYSSSDIRSGQMNAVKDSFSKTNKLAYSRENILKNHETSVSLSSKERRAESKDESRFKSDSDKKELQTSKDNSLTTKINSAPYSVENSDNKATTKRSKKKKKHRKKHKKVDIFDTNERDQTKSDKHTNEIVKEKSTEDQTLPSFIKNPKFGDQDTSNTMFDSNNGAHHLDEQIGSTKFPDYNDAQNPYGRNQPFGNNTFQDYNDAQNPYGRNQPFGNQMGNNTFQDYNDPQNPYGRNQPFGNQMGNNTFQDYNDPQNPYGRDQPFGNKMGNNTFPDYNDPQNPYGRDQPFGNKMGNNTFPDYNDPQNPYGRNQPLGNQMGNNTFQDYNDAQNPYAKNQPFGNQMENNTFQDYDAQNPYGRNQPFGNQMGNNTFQDYDAKNQPFGNQMGNNTFQDYNDPQNPYAKNQPFGNQMGNNTFQDYDAQNPYGRNQPFGNQMGNNTFQDYDAQNPYGKNQPFGNQMGNNTFQDYDVQNPYAKNQPFGNQMGNNTFQDYNDPQNQMPLDFNGQQNPYLKNGYPGTNGTFPDYNNQPAPMDANQFAKNQNNMQNIPTNQSNANVLNPLNNYDEMNNHQFNGNGDINNQNAPGPSQNFVPPQSNVGKYQALNNNLGNFPVQNNVVDPNKVEQSQLQSATQKNIPSNDTPPTPGNQNPSGIHQQVNVTNFYISTLSKLFLNNETISQIEVDVEAKGVNDTLKSSVPCEMVKNNGSTTTIAKSITMARVSNITMSTFINVTCINSHSLMNLETKFSEDKQNVTKLPLLQNCSKLENNDYQPYENKSISFSVEDWLANSNVTFDTNIFENVSSKPVTEKEHATLIEIGNETKTSVQNHFSNSSDVIEETKKLTQATTIPTTTSDHITDEWTTKVTVCVIRKNISNESQLIMDKHKLEELLDSIYTSNTSSMNVKTVLDKLLKNTAASDWKPILSTTDIEGLRTPLDTQQLPEYFSVNISGSPYVLMKQESSKLNPGLSNVQNDENIINPSNSFGRGSNSLNAFQNVNAQPNYLGANYFNPQQNFMNPEPNPLYPYNFLSQQSPLIVPNNIPGQDYQMPLVNPFLEPGNNLSYGPYQQVYPNYPPPLIPPLASPYPPMPLALPQPFFGV